MVVGCATLLKTLRCTGIPYRVWHDGKLSGACPAGRTVVQLSGLSESHADGRRMSTVCATAYQYAAVIVNVKTCGLPAKFR